MPRGTHALMQDTHHLDCVLLCSVHDDMGTNKVKPVCVRQFPALVPKLWILTKQHQDVVQLVAVGQQLLMPPPLAGVAQDAGEIFLCLWGKLEVQFMGGHQDQSAGRCASWR